MPEPSLRLVMPVDYAAIVTPGSVKQTCARCDRPVWVDMDQPIPDPARPVVNVCLLCGLDDPELAPEIWDMWETVRNAAAWAEGGEEWPFPEGGGSSG